MKSFFTAFYNSLFNSAWLKSKRIFPGPAWSYFCLFVFAVALVTIIPIALTFRPFISDVGRNFAATAPDFEANLNGGKLSVQKLAQPYVYRSNSDNFILVVDTVSTNTVTMDQFVTDTAANTMLVTSDRVEFHDAAVGESRTQSWAGLPDFSLSKTAAEALLNTLTKPWFMALAILVIFIGLYLGFFVGKLYNILLVTLLVSVAARLLSRAVKFGELFTIGLYAVTLPSLIGLVLTLSGVQFTDIQLIALLAFMLAVVFTREAGETQSPKTKI